MADLEGISVSSSGSLGIPIETVCTEGSDILSNRRLRLRDMGLLRLPAVSPVSHSQLSGGHSYRPTDARDAAGSIFASIGMTVHFGIAHVQVAVPTTVYWFVPVPREDCFQVLFCVDRVLDASAPSYVVCDSRQTEEQASLC